MNVGGYMREYEYAVMDMMIINIGLKLKFRKWRSWHPVPSLHIDGEAVETVADFIFLGSKSLQMVAAAMKLKDACSLEEKLWST